MLGAKGRDRFTWGLVLPRTAHGAAWDQERRKNQTDWRGVGGSETEGAREGAREGERESEGEGRGRARGVYWGPGQGHYSL